MTYIKIRIQVPLTKRMRMYFVRNNVLINMKQ